MSRIDEALRKVARAELLDDRFAGLDVEPRTMVVDPGTLERYAIEGPTVLKGPRELKETAQHASSQRAATAVADSADALVRPITLPPAMENKLVIGRDISPLTVEEYRRLAAVLHHLQAEHGLKTLMVTSAVPQEGKTLTITNLALTLSESYQQRVLLIDADVRRPSVHELFGIHCGEGLAEVVADGARSMPVVELSPSFSILTAGRRMASPMAALTSERMRTVVSEAAAGFDWVLLDTPPVGLLPDAQLVARLSDGVLFVIAAGMTPYALVQRAVTELGAERVVGTVLNRVEPRNLSAGHYYGSYYGVADTETARRR